MKRLVILLAFFSFVLFGGSVVKAQYIGPAASCASGWCLGTNAGSCYNSCTFDPVLVACRPTSSVWRSWTCNTNACIVGVPGCGASTCTPWNGICGNCGGVYCSVQNGCYTSCDVHGNATGSFVGSPGSCTTCVGPSADSVSCCGNDPSATPTRTPTPGGPTGGGGGPSPTPGGGGASPTPTRTPTPAAGVPTGLSATCLAGNQVRLSWNAVAGSDFYSLRVDSNTVSWGPPASCSVSPSNGTGPGDFCRDTAVGGATNYTFNITAGVTYSWWMHARRSADPAYWSGVAGGEL